MQFLNEEGLIQALMARIRADMPNVDQQLTSIVQEVIKLNSEGHLSNPAALKLHQAAIDRRHRQAKAASDRDQTGLFAARVGIIEEDGDEVTPELAIDDTRRRTQRCLCAVASIPGPFKSYFTQAELSVCSQTAIQCRHNSECRLSHAELRGRDPLPVFWIPPECRQGRTHTSDLARSGARTAAPVFSAAE